MAYRVFSPPAAEPYDDRPRPFGRRQEREELTSRRRRARRANLIRALAIVALALGLGASALVALA